MESCVIKEVTQKLGIEWCARVARFITGFTCVGLLFLVIAATAFGQETSPSVLGITSSKNLRYYQGLRDRGLYQLIEMLCQRELNRPNLSPNSQLFYRIELAQTYAAHAQVISIDEAAALWDSAFEILKTRLNNKTPEFASLLEVEKGILRAEQTSQIFWIAIAEPDNKTLITQFLKTARQANSELTTTSQIVSRYLKKPSGSTADNSRMAIRLTAERLAEIQIARARLFVQLAQIQQQNIPERTAAIQQARAIAMPIAKRMTNGFREQSAKLLLLSAARIQKEEAELTRWYRVLNQPGIDLQIKHQATAEYARFLLAENRDTEAAEMILNYGREGGSLSAELDGLRLQALLKMAAVVRKTGEARLAVELEKEVQLRLAGLEKQGESYHAWLVRRLQQRYKLELQFGPEISPKLQQARQAIQSQNWPVAQTNYEAAILLALQNNHGELLIKLGREAAAVDFQIRDYEHAEQLLKSIWESSPVLPEMESIHLLWIYALGRNYDSKPTQEKLSRYLKALQEHRRRYATKPTLGEATWLLAELQFARMQVTRALDLYRTISQTHPRYLAAQLRLVQCYEWILQRVKDLGQPVLPWQNQAVEFAQKTQAIWNNKAIQKPEQAELLLVTSRMLLDARASQPASLQQQIPKILTACQAAIGNKELDADAKKRWRKAYHTAKAMQGILLVSRGEVDEARRLFASEKDSPASSEEQIFMARQLGSVRGDDIRVRVIVAELLLQLTNELQAGSASFQKLTRQQSIEIRELRAEAFAASEQTTKAVALYEQLLAEMPEKQNYVNRLARLLEECNNQEHWEKALALWKDRVRREKQGTETWLEARYHLAVASIQLNRIEEARKIVQVTLLLYPDIGSKDLQNRYQKLAKKLEL